jgi:hypothetical protein
MLTTVLLFFVAERNRLNHLRLGVLVFPLCCMAAAADDDDDQALTVVTMPLNGRWGIKEDHGGLLPRVVHPPSNVVTRLSH